MPTVCKNNECAGCMACVDICPQKAITIEDKLYAYNAQIDISKCVHCNLCHKVCPNNTQLDFFKTPIGWNQGWSSKDSIRKIGSSGGVASELASTVVELGGWVCSCVFQDGKFLFSMEDKSSKLERFAGSKYIKSNPSGIYSKILEQLKKDRIVLFIGLPCQVAALKKIVNPKLQGKLYTIDLICHGTPSPYFLDLFLGQYGINTYDLEDIRFRVKDCFQVTEKYKGIVTTGTRDRYTTAFLNGLFYTDNCYSCKYARKERVSDITLGDSWGSNLANDQKGKGISLILCQTERGKELLSHTNIVTKPVDIDNAIAHNHQLNKPSQKPENRNEFFEMIKSGKSFNYAVFKCFPKECIKQEVKKVLIRLRLIGGGVM